MPEIKPLTKAASIAKHPATISAGTILAFAALLFTILSYFDGKYVSHPAFTSHVESQQISNADFKRFEQIIEMSNNKLRKEIKDSEVRGLRSRKREILSIPAANRTDMDNVRLDIIKEELEILNFE